MMMMMMNVPTTIIGPASPGGRLRRLTIGTSDDMSFMSLGVSTRMPLKQAVSCQLDHQLYTRIRRDVLDHLFQTQAGVTHGIREYFYVRLAILSGRRR